MGYTEKKKYKWLKEDYIDYSNDLESELSQVKFESQQKLKQITNELTGELEDTKNKLQSALETLKGYRLIEDVSNALRMYRMPASSNRLISILKESVNLTRANLSLKKINV